MKKVLFIFGLCILFNTSFAQIKIGLTAGLNISNSIFNQMNSSTESNNYKAGFQAGVVADFGISNQFSITPELLFSQRGSKGNISYLTLNYMQLPVNATYKFDVGNDSKLFVFAGPYLSYALSGKIKTAERLIQNTKFGSKDDEYKPLDFGLNIGVGYQFEKIFFKLQFNPGLYNLSNVKGSSFKNTNLTFSVGYFIFE